MHACRATLLSLLLTLACEPRAQQTPLDPGQLLAFSVVELRDDVRQEVLLIAEIRATGIRELDRQPVGSRVLRRLDRDRLLLGCRDPWRVVVLDVATGARRELARGRVRCVGSNDTDVLLLDATDDRGTLLRASWRDASTPAVAVVDRAFADVPIVAGNVAVAVDAEDESVWRISLRTGRSQLLWTPPADLRRTRFALAPNGTRLAIGMVGADGCGAIDVLDLATGDPVRRWRDLPVAISPLASTTPALELAFRDDDHLTASESRGNWRTGHGAFVHVTRELRSGGVVDETTRPATELQHVRPSPAGIEQHFEIDTRGRSTGLRDLDTDAVLAAIATDKLRHDDLVVSPLDGRHATARVGDDGQRLVLYAAGSSDRPRVLAETWAYGLTWLPAVE